MYSVKITNDKEILAALARLSSKGMQDTIRKTLKQVATMLKTQTVRNLKKVTERSNEKGSVTNKGSAKQPLVNGITSKVWKRNDGATITIMGDYRLKWFENGTVERTTKKTDKRYKKPKSTGKMKASHFFSNAINEKQKTVVDDINKELTKQISKNYKTDK
jgi:hypothetical protein